MGDAAHRRGALRVCYAVFLNSKIVAERDCRVSYAYIARDMAFIEAKCRDFRWTARTIELSFFKDVRHGIPSVAAITRRVGASRLAGISEDGLRRHHSEKLIRLSPRRVGMRQGDALMIRGGDTP